MARLRLPALMVLCWLAWQPASQAQPEPVLTSITFSEFGQPRSLDPHVAGDVVSTRHCMHVYETLLEYAPFETTRLQPCLAAAMPVYDEAARTYTFTLRDDVYFADDACFPDGKGRRITAADVVFSFKRLAALPQSGGFWVIENQVAGLDAFREAAFQHARIVEHEDAPTEYILSDAWWKHLETDVEGVKAVDARTVRFKLNLPYPQFLHAITLPYGAVVAPEAARKHDLNVHPVGTGPYVLESMSEEEFVYRRNPTYRKVELTGVPADSPLKAYEGRRLPLTDELHYEFVRDDAKAFDAFMKKRYAQTALTKEEFERVIDAEAMKAGKAGDDLLQPEYRKQGLHLRDYPEPTIHYISFNMNDPTFGAPAGEKGRALRRAIAMCIDRRDYIEKFLNGRGMPADQLLPAGIAGSDPACAMPTQTFDATTARKILKNVGFEVVEDGDAWKTLDGGKQVKLSICFRSTSAATAEFADWLTECARKVGINLVARLMSFARFLQTQDEGTGQAYDAGWVMDYPDAQNMLQLLYGPNHPPGINSASYDDSEYNRLYQKMCLLRDEIPAEAAQKRKLIIRLHEILEHDTPWVLMEFRRIISMHWEGYAAAPPNAFNYADRKYVFWTR